MSLVNCYLNAEDRYYICCSECCAIVCNDATLSEVGEYATANVKVLCFDCSTQEADSIPAQLVEFKNTWLMGIDDKIFLAEWLDDGQNLLPHTIRLSKISPTTYFDLKTGYGPHCISLSSSLYLNRNSVKNVVFNADR